MKWFLFVFVILALMLFALQPKPKLQSDRSFYSITERRMPCGRIQRREVVKQNNAWRKTVTLMDPSGRVLASKTRTVEPEHCSRIQAGQFVPGL